MPEYIAEKHSCWVFHHSRLIDTNVLVAYFDPSDKHHESAKNFIDYLALELQVPLVPVSVVVEAWGVCPEKERHKMIEWLAQPGNIEILPEDSDVYAIATTTATKYDTDIVDALLIHHAKAVTSQCSLPSPLPIATFDNRNWHIWEHMRDSLVYWNPASNGPYF